MKKYLIPGLLALFLMILILLITTLSSIQVVTAATLSCESYQRRINVSGEFENTSKTNIILSYPVCIKEVFVKENDFVNKGQALFSIDKAKMEQLLNSGYDTAVLGISGGNLASRQTEYSNIYMVPDVIYAPDSGVVTGLAVYSGSVVMPGKSLVRVRSDSGIVAKFTLSQPEYGSISAGDRVNIVPVAFSNTSYTGTVSDRPAVVKKQPTTTGEKVIVEVFANIDNADEKIANGLQFSGKIQSAQVKNINTLDMRYINQDDGGEYVYLLSGGKAEKRYIQTGLELENSVEVTTYFPKGTLFLKGDITEGDKVVISTVSK